MANVNPKMRSRARLTVVHPQAAGIDIGSRFHVVAVPAELDDEPVRTGLRRIRILSPSPAFCPPKSVRKKALPREIACGDKLSPLAGTIPGLMGGSAYKGSPCYKRSAGLHTPSGPRLSTWV